MPTSRHHAIHVASPTSRQHPAQQKSAFSIFWAVDPDSVCDLPCLLTYVDNFASNRHKADATRTPTTGRSARCASNGAAAISCLHLPYLSRNILSPPASLLCLHLHQLQAFLRAYTSSTRLQGQVLLHSLVIYFTLSVFSSFATSALPE